MRRFFFVLLIALLLLRGWMGEAMATGMAASWLQPAQSATKTIATHAHDHLAQAHFEHETASARALHGDCADHPADKASGAHCGTHAACQACQTVAPTPAIAYLAPVFTATLLPRAAAARFASADAALGQKPPIS